MWLRRQVPETNDSDKKARHSSGDVGGVGHRFGGLTEYGRLVDVDPNVRGGGDGDHAHPDPGLGHLPVVHDHRAEVRRDQSVDTPARARQKHDGLDDARPQGAR